MKNQLKVDSCQLSERLRLRQLRSATNYQLPTTNSRGFTLIELLVVTAILVVVATIILTNYSKFGGTVVLRSLAYDMALSIRQAQTYGTAVRRTKAGDFTVGYGIHARTASPSSYILFADSVENGHYDAGEAVETFSLSSGFQIADLCSTAGVSPTEECGVDKLDIVFKRPEPDAKIRINDLEELQQRSRIVVRSPRGNEVGILVEATGQISVGAIAQAP